ncbi:hypothetical protein ACX3YG_09815 [Pseudomonas wadenswilerensis]
MKFAWLLLFWLLVLLLGAVINHFREKKLDFSYGYLIFLLALCAFDLVMLFTSPLTVYMGPAYALSYVLTSYFLTMLPVGLVSWRFRRKRAREAALGPVHYRLAGYKDLAALNQWVAGFMYALIAVSGYCMFTEVLNYQLLSAYDSTAYQDPARLVDDATIVQRYQAAVAFYFKGVLPIAACLLLRWVYRARLNIRLFAASAEPLVQPWKPWPVMREIWQVSHGTPGKPPTLLRCWWGLLLAAGALVLGMLALADSPDLKLMKLAALVTLAESAALVGFSVATVMLVKRVRAAQCLRANEGPDEVAQPSGQLVS